MSEKFISAERIYLVDTDMDPLSSINRLFCGWVVRDRFGVLNAHSPYRLSDKADAIPVKFDAYMPLSVILDSVAKKIIANKERITVSWSGGVDSTAVIVALLRNLKDDERSRLTVVCTTSSCEEAPNFYLMMRDMGLNVIVTEDLMGALRVVEADAITSGWCADQLFGSDIHLSHPGCYGMNWLDALSIIWQRSRGSMLGVSSLSALEDIYQGYANHLGLKLEKFCEFAWLFNFGCKFSYIQNVIKSQLAGHKNQGKSIGFFDDELFQRWSITNFENIRSVDIYQRSQYYKHSLKLYIYEFTNDEEYYRKKTKKNSWGMSHIPVDRAVIIGEDGEPKIFKRKDGRSDNPALAELNQSIRQRYLK